MVYHTFRHANYHHKRAGRRRAAISRRRKRKWRRKSTAKKALVTAKRAYRLARLLKKPKKYIEWCDPFELYSSNSTYGVAGLIAGDVRYHFRQVTGLGTGNLVSGYMQMSQSGYHGHMYSWDWKQHPFPVVSRLQVVEPGA